MDQVSLFLEPISAKELQEAYILEPLELKALLRDLSNEYTKVKIAQPDRMGDSNRLIYSVDFFLSNHEQVLDQSLQRWLFNNKQCLSQPTLKSKVAYRLKFYCRKPFQGGGLAKQLLQREEAIFRKWGAREIQLLAMDSGRWIWTRPQFGYQISAFDMHSLLQQFQDWQRRGGIAVTGVPGTLAELPRDFLETAVNSLTLFKLL
jgi:GNAT superfamily N-acetyltransferase